MPSLTRDAGGSVDDVPRLAHVCPIPGCPELVDHGQARCERHGSGPANRHATTAWRRLRAVVLERDGHRCQAPRLGASTPCRGPLSAGHITPYAAGGADEAWNLIACCRTHNLEAQRVPVPRWQRDAQTGGPPALGAGVYRRELERYRQSIARSTPVVIPTIMVQPQSVASHDARLTNA